MERAEQVGGFAHDRPDRAAAAAAYIGREQTPAPTPPPRWAIAHECGVPRWRSGDDEPGFLRFRSGAMPRR